MKYRLHEYLYTPFSLERLFRDAEFGNPSIVNSGSGRARKAQILGLLVRHSSMSRRKHTTSRTFLKPQTGCPTGKDAITGDTL